MLSEGEVGRIPRRMQTWAARDSQDFSGPNEDKGFERSTSDGFHEKAKRHSSSWTPTNLAFIGERLRAARATVFNAGQLIKKRNSTVFNAGHLAKTQSFKKQLDEDIKDCPTPASPSKIVKPTSVKECGLELSKKGMVVLPFKVSPHVLKKARHQAGKALENTHGSDDGVYDVPLTEKGLPDESKSLKPSLQERRILDLWEPVIEASYMNKLPGFWALATNGFLACTKGAGRSPWPKPPPSGAVEESIGVMRSSRAGSSLFPCVHVIVPLVDLTPTRGGDGPSKLDLKAGDILIVDCNVKHVGFGINGRGPQPLLYWTYVRRPMKPQEEEQMKKLDLQQQQQQDFSSWARKRGFRLPQVALSLIKRQDLRKSAWDEQNPYEAGGQDWDDEIHAQESGRSMRRDPQASQHAGLEDANSLPLTMHSKQAGTTVKPGNMASFDNINATFKAISTTVAGSPRHSTKQIIGADLTFSSIHKEGRVKKHPEIHSEAVVS